MAGQRLESGQVNLRGAGYEPIQQVNVPQVNQVALQVSANASQTLAQALDRMAAQINQDAYIQRAQEGLQFAAQNPLTEEQFKAAKEGRPVDLGGNQLSAFGNAVRKARSLELAYNFEMEGMNQLVGVQSQVEDGSMTSEQASMRVAQITDGLSRSIGKVDGDAAFKFRANMAAHGNAVLQAAYRTELQRAKAERITKFDMSYVNAIKLLELEAQENPDTFDKYADNFRVNIGGMAMMIGDASIQREYSGKLEPAVKNAQINAVVKSLMTDEALGDYRGTIAKLRTGDMGKYSGMVMNLMKNDFETYQKIEEKFTAMVRQRKEGIDLAMVDANAEADVLLRQMYSTNDPRKQRQLLTQLQGLPTKPETIKAARDFVNSDNAAGPQTDNLIALGNLSKRVQMGLATPEEINSAPLKRETRKQLMMQWANPSDDLNYGINQIGLSVGIQNSNLPPELKSAEARQLAVENRNTLVMELYNYARTPDEKGNLPSAIDLRAKGDELAKRAAKGMGKAFNKAAEANSNTALLMLPELKGVDLNDNAAVENAIAAAVKAKRNQTNINAARDAIENYRANMKKVQEGKE